MEQNFETEVLTRLAVIESKLDGYKEIKKVTYDTARACSHNEEEIKELQDKFKWMSRTTVGAVITAVIGLAFALIKIGLGVE